MSFIKIIMDNNKIYISPVKEMEVLSSPVPGAVSLAQGIPSFDTPQCIKRKAIEAIQNGKTACYSLSSGLLELREAIEYDLAKQNIFYDFEREIIVTAGSIGAILVTLLAILNPGDEVLIPDPTYTSYQSAIIAARGVPVFVPLNEKHGWAFDIEELRKKITPKTKAILYCNPNNPTGTIYNREQLMQIAELAQLHDLYVLSDEVYKDIIFDDNDFFSLAKFSDFRKRFVYIFSFSKTYAMTGWRVAYLATDRELAGRIMRMHDVMVTCAPVVSQWAALAALEMATNDIGVFLEGFKKRRDLICEKLSGLSDWFEYQRPSSTYFVFPKVKQELKEYLNSKQKKDSSKNNKTKDFQKRSLSWRFSLRLLYEAKVVVVPGIAFGPSGEDHIRLCFGRSENDILTVMNRIEKFVNTAN